MMRIIQVCPYDLSRPGGVRSHILGLSKSLMDAGHEVVIIGPDSSLASRRPLIEILEADHAHQSRSYQVIQIGYRRSAVPLWGTQVDFSYAGTSEKAALRDFLHRWNPDVVHFHTPWTPFLPWQVHRQLKKLQSGKKRPPKRIATFHDSPPNTWLGSILGRFVMPLAARFLLPKFDEVISVSGFQRQFISKWSSKKIHIIPNGIHPEADNKDAAWSPSDSILFLGRLEARKGLIHVLRAYELLKKRVPSAKLIVAGEGPQRREGEDFLKSRRLDAEFRGMVSEDGKKDLLLNAGVFVSPALYGESFGIVLIEAMARGVPVAGYGNPGYLSVVEGICEENFPAPGDVNALADVLEKILGDPEYALELSKKGLIHARQFDWNVLLPRIVTLYSQHQNHPGILPQKT